MKRFTFQFDITGNASIEITAKNIKEAIKLLKNGKGNIELTEWDIDYPHDFKKLDDEDVQLYLCNEDDV